MAMECLITTVYRKPMLHAVATNLPLWPFRRAFIGPLKHSEHYESCLDPGWVSSRRFAAEGAAQSNFCKTE